MNKILLILIFLIFTNPLTAKDEVKDLLQKAQTALKNNDYQPAIESLTKALALEKNDYTIYKLRANAYVELNLFDLASSDYNEALKLKEIPELYNFKGMAYLKKGEYDTALICFRKAVNLDTNSAESLTNLGLAYLNQNRHLFSIPEFDKAIAKNPDYYEAYHYKARAYFSLQEYDKAISNFKKVLEIKPDYHVVYNSLATTYMNRLIVDSAIECVNKAIELQPTYDEAFTNRAMIYEYLKKYDEAVKDYQRASELNPIELRNYYKISGIYDRTAEYDKAIEWLTKAAKVADSNQNTKNEVQFINYSIKMIERNKKKQIIPNKEK